MSEVADIDLNLWSFIKSTQATQIAPLKSMQKFILSLNKAELTHLIISYLQSKLSQRNSLNNFNPDGLSLRQSADKILSNQSTNRTLHTIDQHIIFKLNAKYGIKYQKKAISKTASRSKKKRRRSPNHLLLIPPQVLAYSFQFLSFRELCKTQCVCTHFMCLNKQYPALVHYYFKMDLKFCQKAMRFKVPLSNLSFFKRIDVNAAYCNTVDKDQKRRTRLFKHILKTIIKQSRSNLDILSINVPYFTVHSSCINSAFSPPFCTLLFIMNTFTQLPITTLFWHKDFLKPSLSCKTSNMLQRIQSQFPNTFPNMSSFSMGTKIEFAEHYYGRNRDLAKPKIIPVDTLKQYILAPVITHFASKLHTLKIDLNYHLLSSVIQLIAKKMVNLKRLTIFAIIQLNESAETGNDYDIVNDMNNLHQNVGLQALSLQLRRYTVANESPIYTHATNIMIFLFSSFIGITEFEFDFCYHCACIHWKAVFSRLIHNKRMYSLNNIEHNALLPLESLHFRNTDNIQGSLLMSDLCKMKYRELKHIGLEFMYVSSQKHREFIYNRFIPFLRLYDDNNRNAMLKSIKLRIWIYNDCQCLEPVVDLLCKIPSSVASIRFELPSYGRHAAIPQHESTPCIKKLCEMALQTNQESKLETISFDGLRILPSVRNHLLFWYGFHNKISILQDKYYLQMK
eukprot:54486_1